MEKLDFIKLMLQNRNLSVNDKKRLLLLATREIEQVDTIIEPKENKDYQESKRKDSVKKAVSAKHAPKDTAAILSLFDRRDGLKYLTHNYDNENITINEMLNQAKKVFEKNKRGKNLPNSLVALINHFIYGEEWVDANGETSNDGYGNPQWQSWSFLNGGKHPIMDIGGMEKTIQRFRHTIRIVAPDLKLIVKRIADRFPSLHVDMSQLESADFYTNVYILNSRLMEIFKDINDHAGQEHKEIHVEYMLDLSGDFFLHRILISQIGSFSAKRIKDVLRKYDSTGGFFYDNAEKLRGYCNWSVESLWDGQPFRWNILDDTGASTIEPIDSNRVKGFTHILSFYQKN